MRCDPSCAWCARYDELAPRWSVACSYFRAKLPSIGYSYAQMFFGLARFEVPCKGGGERLSSHSIDGRREHQVTGGSADAD